MKVRPEMAEGICEGCHGPVCDLNVVTFEQNGTIRLLCEICLEWTKELLRILDIKEIEA